MTGWKKACLAISAALHIKARLLAAAIFAKLNFVEEGSCQAKVPLVLESTSKHPLGYSRKALSVHSCHQIEAGVIML